MEESPASKALGIVAIVLGAIGFFFCPLVVALTGLICGIVGFVIAKQPGEKKICTIGIIVGAVGLVGGTILALVLGMPFATSSQVEPLIYALWGSSELTVRFV